MAYDTVTPVKISRDTWAVVTPLAITHGNTIKIPVTDKDNIILYINNTTAGAVDVTITAGDFGARSVLGDMVLEFAQDTFKVINLETSRFLNDDGFIYGEYEAAMTGFIWAAYIE
jgi:hypothetical protein